MVLGWGLGFFATSPWPGHLQLLSKTLLVPLSLWTRVGGECVDADVVFRTMSNSLLPLT